MNEAVTTTSEAPTNPTTPVIPAATPAAPQPRAGSIPDAQFDNLPPAEQDRYARVRKGPDGGSEWVLRDQLAKEPAADGKQPAATGDATVSADGILKIGEMLLSQDDIKSLIAEKAQADLRKTQVPATAEAYTATLPQEFKLPAGVEYSFNETDPAYMAARAWAHGQGFTQQQFSELLSFHANSQAAEQVLIGNAAKAEVEKLGAMGTARVTAIDTWLRGMCGDDLGRHVRGMMLTAKAVEGMEKIMQKMSSQGVMSFRQDGREPAGAPGRVSDAEYNAMNQAQRWEYARQFDQSQFQNGKTR